MDTLWAWFRGTLLQSLTILMLTRSHVRLLIVNFGSALQHEEWLGWYSQYVTKVTDTSTWILSHMTAVYSSRVAPQMQQNSVSLGWTPMNTVEPTTLIFARDHVVWVWFRGTLLQSLTILMLTRSHVRHLIVNFGSALQHEEWTRLIFSICNWSDDILNMN